MECKATLKYISPTLGGADLILHIDGPVDAEGLDGDLRLKLTKWRNRRSNDANAYFHCLSDQLADARRMSKAKMKNFLLFRYGQKCRDRDGNLVIIKTNADEDELVERSDIHCWYLKNADDGTPMYVLLEHSRFFDSREMSILIDGVVEECKAQGIDTITPAEIDELKQKWGIEVQKQKRTKTPQSHASIIQGNKECYVCGTTLNLHEHHIFGGPNRKWSEKYGLKVWLCAPHHNMSDAGVHFNKELDTQLKQIGQAAFEDTYINEDFIKIFGRNYLG